MADPWDEEKRERVSHDIAKEAERVKKRLGATSVLLVALYKDGEHSHALDAVIGGPAATEIYKAMLTAHEMRAEFARHGKKGGFVS